MRYFAPILAKIKAAASSPWAMLLMLACSVTLFSLSPLGIAIESHLGLQALFYLRGPIKPPQDIAIIALNTQSAENLGLSRYTHTWSRKILADLIIKLHAAQAKLIVLDIAFKEARQDADDQALESALKLSSKVILFKYLKRHQISSLNKMVDIEEEIDPLPRFAEQALAVGAFVLPKNSTLITHSHTWLNLPSGLQATQPLLAYLAQNSQRDLQQAWQMLGTQTPMPPNLQDFAQQLKQAVSANPTQNSLNQNAILKSIQLPQQIPINYYGGPQTLNTFNIDQVLSWPADKRVAAFKNKIIYVGYSETQQTEQIDSYRTVFSLKNGLDISGVEISATLLANLIHQQNLLPLGLGYQLCILALAFLLPWCGTILKPTPAYFIQAVLIFAYLMAACLAFEHHYYWWPIVLPLIAWGSSLSFVWTWQFYQQKQREKAIQYTLCQYLPKDAAQKLSRNFKQLENQRQLVQGICLITDIKGYTTLAETLAPDALHSLMNRYYAILVKAVQKNEGIIGNLVGDGMLALWTSHAITGREAYLAVKTVLDIQEALNQDEELKNQLPTHYGLHGGQFSLGNLGHKGHFEYSPVGDIINTTSRIEHFNRSLGTRILCSQVILDALYNNIAPQFQTPIKQLPPARYLGDFQLRNKTNALTIFTFEPILEAHQKQYLTALQHFKQQQFQLAYPQFYQLAKTLPDGPSQYFCDLCNHSSQD